MQTLVLSYFDIIEGPRIFLKAPKVDENLEILEQIPSLLNLYHEGFFVNISAEFQSANLIFEMPSAYARGKYEILMISLVVDIESTINLNLSEDILKEFVNDLDKIEDAFLAFYVVDSRYIGDPEKLEVVENAFQKFYQRSQHTFRALKEAEIRYRHLFELSPFSITILNMNGVIVDVNPANEKLFGYTKADLLNRDFRKYLAFNREKLPIFVQTFKEILKGEQTKPIEIQITKKDGVLVWVMITYSLIKIGNENLIMVITQDIDKSKRAEEELKESEEKFRTIAEQSLLGIAVMQDNRIKYFNQTWADIFGYTIDELKSWGPGEFITAVHPDDKKIVKQQAHYKQTGSLKASPNYVFRAFKKSGDVIWIENFGKTFTYRGRPANLSIIIDITEKVEFERRIHESEERYRFIAENANDLISIMNNKFEMEYFNEEIHEKLLGYTKEDLAGISLLGYLHPDDVKTAAKDIRKGALKGEGVGEFRIRTKDGGYKWVETKGKITNPNLEDLKVLLIGRDITDRKLAEQELRESEEKFRVIAENSLIGISIAQKNKMVYYNQQFAEIHGFLHEEVKDWRQTDFSKFLHPEDRDYFFDQLNSQLIMKDTEFSFQYRIIRKNKEIAWIDRTSTIFTFKGEPAMLTLTRDITFQKEAEKLLKESEEQNRNLINNISDAITEVDMESRYTYLSPQTFDLTGYRPEELLGQKLYKIVHPDDFIGLVNNIKEAYNSRKSVNFEYRFQHKDGHYIHVSTRGSFVEVNDEEKFIGIVRDITERKEIQEKLKTSEVKFRNLINNISDIVVDVGIDGRYTYLSPQSFNLIGYHPEELFGQQLYGLVHPDDLNELINNVKEAFNSRDIMNFEFRIQHKDGHYVYVSTRGSFVEVNSVKKFIGIIRDITERKEIEEKLKESEQKFRNLINNISDGIAEVDFSGKFTYVGPQSYELFGYTQEEFVGKRVFNYVHPDDIQNVIDYLKQAYNSKEKTSIEYRVEHKDGHFFPVSLRGSFVKDKDKEKFIGVIRDISERKEFEDKIKESEEKYRLITENATDLIIIIDEKFKTEYVNEGACLKKLGYTFSEMVNMRPPALLHPEDVGVATEVLRNAAMTGEGMLRARLKHKSGTFAWYQISGSRFFDPEGNPKTILVARDIHEQTLAEEKLKISEERNRRLIENISDTIIEADITGVSNYFSPQLYDLVGYRPEELVGTRIYKFIHPADFNMFVSKLNLQLDSGEIFTSEIKLKHKDGYYVPASFRGTAVKEKGKLRVIGVLRDITEQKRVGEQLKASEEKHRLITDNLNDMICILDHRARFEYINEDVVKKLTGHSNELIGTSCLKLIHPDDVKTAIKDLQKGIDSGEHGGTIRMLKKDGSIIWMEIHGKAFKDKDGSIKGLLIGRDVTEQKNINEQIKESEEKYRLITENAHDLIALLNEKFEVLYINEGSMFNIAGYTPDEVIGRDATDFVHPEDIYLAVGLLKEGFQTGKGSADIRFKHKNGSTLWLQLNGTAFTDKNGNLRAIIIARDVTEAKEAEIKLKESEEKYRALSETSPDSVILQDFEGYIVDCNVKTEEYLNKSREELIGKSFLDVFITPENKMPWIIEMFKKIRVGEINYPLTIEYFTESGESKWIENHSSLFRIEDKTYIQTIIQDITIRKKAIENLRNSELKYRHLFETTPYAIALIDMSGKFIEANSNIEVIFGYKQEEYIGKKFTEFPQFNTVEDGIIVKNFKKLMKNETPEPHELRIYRKDGSQLWVLMQASLVQGPDETLIQVVVQDINDMKMAQEKLMQSEERYRIVAEQALMGVAIIQEDKIVFINKLLRAVFGDPDKISKDYLVKDFFKLIHPDDQEKALNQFKLLIEGGDIALSGYTYRPLNSEGKVRWFDIYAKALQYQGKNTVLITLVDVSERIEAEQKLRESEEKYRETLK